ncbi:Fungalysin/Thermolysin Extracellular metalloproteinase 5 [Allomyces javanicus]|nr:Fungalysin/Thermolysin Extracellular metalloproteinase 5 [Allomyces javanicus]
MSRTQRSSAGQFALLFLLALVATQAITVVDAAGRTRKTPAIAYKTFNKDQIPVPSAKSTAATESIGSTSADPKTVATAFLTTQLQFPASEFVIKNVVPVSNGMTAVYVRQLVNGIEVVNGDINLNIKNGKVVTYGDSFYRGARPSKPNLNNQESLVATKTPDAAFKSLASFVGAQPKSVEVKANTQEGASSKAGPTYTISSDIAAAKVPAKYSYVQDGNNLKLVYSMQVKMANTDSWYHGHVNVQTGAVEAINDWASDARYTVLPIGTVSAKTGPFVDVDTSSVIKSNASPKGYHATNAESWTYTRGENAFVLAPNNVVPVGSGGDGLDFTAWGKPDFSKNADQYTMQSAVQLFYEINYAHDLSYQYGFDEVSGNFQVDNFNKGGAGGDAVLGYAQSAEDHDNASFATPPDGQQPVTRQYIFRSTNPTTDGVYEPMIPLHEYMHGISDRLTGGPANTDCLSTVLSSGMSEGWSDVFALVVNVFKADSDPNGAYVVGTYVTNNPKGFRTYPYSPDMSINPYKYSSLKTMTEEHGIGEVWATILVEIYFNFVKKYGYGDLMAADFSKGNSKFLKTVFDALKLQPCNPHFLHARNALLQADINMSGGSNYCDIFVPFAKRGLGWSANGDFVDNFERGPYCG